MVSSSRVSLSTSAAILRSPADSRRDHLQAFIRTLATAAPAASTSASASLKSKQSLSDKLAAGPSLDDFIAGSEELVEAAAAGPSRVSMGNTTQ